MLIDATISIDFKLSALLVNIRDLQYLVAVAEHEHFGKAANSCFVSQPALSMQIKKLEEQLGVKLIERTNKSVQLTDVGIKIAAQARAIIVQVEEVRDTAKAAQDVFSGELRIGIFPTLSPYLLPLIISHLSKQFPKLSLYLIEEQTSNLLQQLKDGKIHGAFLSAPVADHGLAHIDIFEEEFFLAVGNDHPLSTRRFVKQCDLADHELLLLEEGHCLRNQALSLCQTLKVTEKHNFRATSLETLRHMISAGIGITLIPELACNTDDKNITYLSFKKPKPVRKVGLYWRTSSCKGIVFKEIAAQIQQVLTHRGKTRIID